MNMDTTKLSKEEYDFMTRMEALFCEIACLNSDIKQIKEEAKDKGFKHNKLAKIAKLRSESKTSNFVSEMQEMIETIRENNL